MNKGPSATFGIMLRLTRSGIAAISRESFPDPTHPDWVAVEIIPKKKLKHSVTLAQVKATRQLHNMALVRVSRLSVQPVKKEEFDMILAMGSGT